MEFSWKRIFKVVGAVVAGAVVVAGIYLFVTWRPVKIVWASWIYDRRETFLDCEQLPFYPQVQKAFMQHQDVAVKVRTVLGVTDFYPEETPCVNFAGGIQFIKGQAVLKYTSRTARAQAEKIIGGNFFGIPYSGEQIK